MPRNDYKNETKKWCSKAFYSNIGIWLPSVKAGFAL